MSVFDIYSKRNKEEPDIFVYDEISKGLRIQIWYIIEDFLSRAEDFFYLQEKSYSRKNYWFNVRHILVREHEKEVLSSSNYGTLSAEEEVEKYFKKLENHETDKILDVIEVCFSYIDQFAIFIESRTFNIGEFENLTNTHTKYLNVRFKEKGIGYRYESKKIIKTKNEILHQEITKPTLYFLSKNNYSTINEEYLKAHQHFRNSEFKACLTECLKAFESTMKVICSEKGWDYEQKDTSNKLIKIILDNNLIPSFMQTKITGIRAILESGIPTIRNKTSGHGQGVTKITVDESLASYGLNITGSCIKFLIEQHEK